MTEQSGGVPEIKMMLTTESITSPARKLHVKLFPEQTRCGQVITMGGPVKLHECGASYQGACIDPPPHWQVKTTGPGNHGYFYAVCPSHAQTKSPEG